jgi:hypothetical protein
MVRIYRGDGRGSDIWSLSHRSRSDITAGVSQCPIVADNHWDTTHFAAEISRIIWGRTGVMLESRSAYTA